MRRLESSFYSGPGLPGARTLLTGVACLGAVGWLMLAAQGKPLVLPEEAARTAPPAVAAHVAAPHGVHSTLATTVERQQTLLDGLRERQAADAERLTALREEIAAVHGVLTRPAGIPARKPSPASAPPSPERLEALESEAVALETALADLSRRLEATQTSLVEARALLQVAVPETRKP